MLHIFRKLKALKWLLHVNFKIMIKIFFFQFIIAVILIQFRFEEAKPVLQKAIEVSQQSAYWHCRLIFQLAVRNRPYIHKYIK